MFTGTKFWPINTAANYLPSAHPAIAFYGNTLAGTTAISGIDPSVTTVMSAITAPNLGVVGLGASANDIVTSVVPGQVQMTKQFPSDQSNGRFVYFDKRYPAAGIDGPIQAVLCLDNSHGNFVFIDAGGRTVTIPDTTLAKGAIYYFEIAEVITVTSGKLIGIAGK